MYEIISLLNPFPKDPNELQIVKNTYWWFPGFCLREASIF